MNSTALTLIRKFADEIDIVVNDKPSTSNMAQFGKADKITKVKGNISSLRGWLSSLEDQVASEEVPKQELWDAILVECGEIQKENPATGSSRGTAFYQGKDRAMCIMTIGLRNGAKMTNIIEAHRWRDQVSVSVNVSYSNNDRFWQEKIAFKKRLIIIDHVCYQTENENSSSHFRGFGGQKFVIEFFDGRKLETTNLWHIGIIPPYYRRTLKDNAKFIRSEKKS